MAKPELRLDRLFEKAQSIFLKQADTDQNRVYVYDPEGVSSQLPPDSPETQALIKAAKRAISWLDL